MGYDSSRFLGQIYEMFLCSYCSMVLENPVETPCKHIFCDGCITPWLLNNNICPIDRKPLSQRELKTPSRLILECLASEKIKCSFELEGCEVIVALENLQNHLASCKYNPSSDIICYKGCNMKIRRSEYKTHDCIAYLVNRMKCREDEIRKLTWELTEQKENIQRKDIRQEQEIVNLKQIVSRTHEQNTELNNENRLLKQQIARRNDVVKVQKENVAKVGENSTILLNKTQKWRILENLRYSEHSDILECDKSFGECIAQSYYPLGSANFSFKVETLHLSGDIFIGLSRANNRTNIWESNAICCGSNGATSLFGRRKFDERSTWAVGDIIECGITCPQNLHEIEGGIINVYLSKNGELVYETVVKMRPDHFFLTVSFYTYFETPSSRVKILSN